MNGTTETATPTKSDEEFKKWYLSYRGFPFDLKTAKEHELTWPEIFCIGFCSGVVSK